MNRNKVLFLFAAMTLGFTCLKGQTVDSTKLVIAIDASNPIYYLLA